MNGAEARKWKSQGGQCCVEMGLVEAILPSEMIRPGNCAGQDVN